MPIWFAQKGGAQPGQQQLSWRSRFKDWQSLICTTIIIFIISTTLSDPIQPEHLRHHGATSIWDGVYSCHDRCHFHRHRQDHQNCVKLPKDWLPPPPQQPKNEMFLNLRHSIQQQFVGPTGQHTHMHIDLHMYIAHWILHIACCIWHMFVNHRHSFKHQFLDNKVTSSTPE